MPSSGPSLASLTRQRPDPDAKCTAGGWPAVDDDVLPAAEVDDDMRDRGEPLLPLLTQEVAVGGGQELLVRDRAEQPTEGTGQQQGTGARVDALAGDVDERDLQRLPSSERVATRKSPENDAPPAERSTTSADQPSGSAGISPCARRRSRRSTSIESPRVPWTPSRPRLRANSSTIAAVRGHHEERPGGTSR